MERNQLPDNPMPAVPAKTGEKLPGPDTLRNDGETKRSTDEQRAERQRAVKQSKREAAKHRRHLIYAIMIIFLTFYFVLSLIIGAYYYISFNSTPDEAELFSIVTLNRRNKTIDRVSASAANKAYGLYIPLTVLDNLCDLSVAGDSETLTVMLRKSGESFRCFTDSSVLYINGTPARLSIPMLYANREYYIPMEFVEGFMTGVTVAYAEGECRLSLTDGDDTIIALKLKRQNETERVPEPLLR